MSKEQNSAVGFSVISRVPARSYSDLRSALYCKRVLRRLWSGVVNTWQILMHSFLYLLNHTQYLITVSHEGDIVRV